MTLELRITTARDKAVVSDAVVTDGNASDADYEACLVQVYKGLEIDVPGLEPGEQYRIPWPILRGLKP